MVATNTFVKVCITFLSGPQGPPRSCRLINQQSLGTAVVVNELKNVSKSEIAKLIIGVSVSIVISMKPKTLAQLSFHQNGLGMSIVYFKVTQQQFY